MVGHNSNVLCGHLSLMIRVAQLTTAPSASVDSTATLDFPFLRQLLLRAGLLLLLIDLLLLLTDPLLLLND